MFTKAPSVRPTPLVEIDVGGLVHPKRRYDVRERLHPGEPERVEPFTQARSLVDRHVPTSSVMGAILHGSGVVALGPFLSECRRSSRAAAVRLLPLSSNTDAAKARKSLTFSGYRRGSSTGSELSVAVRKSPLVAM